MLGRVPRLSGDKMDIGFSSVTIDVDEFNIQISVEIQNFDADNSAADVSFSMNLPDEVGIQSLEPENCIATSIIECTYEQIEAGESENIEIYFVRVSDGDISELATLATSNSDENQSNNFVTITIENPDISPVLLPATSDSESSGGGSFGIILLSASLLLFLTKHSHRFYKC